MASGPTTLQPSYPLRRKAGLADAIVLFSIAVLFFAGLSLAAYSSNEPGVAVPISLSPKALPIYTLFSLMRMFTAYILSFLFTIFYGRMAAYNRRAERVMLPLLDVLQSVPILSFLPVVLISLSAFMPQRTAAEIASIVLIFTSQAWNMTFGWYQSLTTLPKELHEASSIFRLNTWMRFKTFELPFATIPLIWNSMMSWAGGWFFLMAAEIFIVGKESFSLPGLGAYLQVAAFSGDYRALVWGLATLTIVILVMDQWIWRPLLAWADRFKIEMVESENPPTSWFYNVWHTARIVHWVKWKLAVPFMEWFDQATIRRSPMVEPPQMREGGISKSTYFLMIVGAGLLIYGAYHIGAGLMKIPLAAWESIAVGLLATMLRVFIALMLAMLWTIPAGYTIGSNPRLAGWLQPVVQVVASLPATALFPVLVASLVMVYEGLNLAAILLMLLGTQWYMLFNIIGGAAAIPQDLNYTASLLGLSRWERWRTLILPALFPFIITGAITASGGAWNASIVAEYITYNGQTLHVAGIGAVIAGATAKGDYLLLFVATISMILTVVVINRLLWRRLYKVAETKYKME